VAARIERGFCACPRRGEATEHVQRLHGAEVGGRARPPGPGRRRRISRNPRREDQPAIPDSCPMSYPRCVIRTRRA
jgi:hypothetical protein